MDEKDRKLLTEYLGECWHDPTFSDILACKVCGEIKENRTYTTPDDMMALKNKMVFELDFYGYDSFLNWAEKKWDILDPVALCDRNFISWLLNPPRFCELVADWLRRPQ